MKKIVITGENLTFEEVVAVSRDHAKIELGDLAKVRLAADYIAKKAQQEKPIYGVTTGFGAKADQVISPENAKELQVNLIRSHATGVGKNLPTHIVRAIMLIRLNTLMKGHSGVQESTVRQLADFLNLGVHPIVPEQGSLGASGDLCPLSHIAMPLIGEGYLEYQGKEYRGEEFFSENQLGLKPLELSYKEGLALNNGTSLMAALGVFACYEFERLIKLEILSSSLMLEAFCARKEAFDEKIHRVRNHAEQSEVASWIRKLTAGSGYIGITPEKLRKHSKTAEIKFKLDEHTEKKKDLLERLAEKKAKPQDAYSFRCMPQVYGASLKTLNHAKEIFAGEINAVVDNPIIFAEEDEIISGGNFHGQPLALALDYLKLAIAETGNLLERQINKLVDPATNDLLEPFLCYDPKNINSGLMIPQYVAASLVSENKVLVHPASADSIPTSANTEDHVSMGAIAGRQALEILGNVKNIVAIALLNAHHAAQIRKGQFAGFGLEVEFAPATNELFEAIRKTSADFSDTRKYLQTDRFLYDDIKAIADSLDSLSAIAEKRLG